MDPSSRILEATSSNRCQPFELKYTPKEFGSAERRIKKLGNPEKIEYTEAKRRDLFSRESSFLATPMAQSTHHDLKYINIRERERAGEIEQCCGPVRERTCGRGTRLGGGAMARAAWAAWLLVLMCFGAWTPRQILVAAATDANDGGRILPCL